VYVGEWDLVGLPDASYLPDMNELGIGVLAATASQTQRRALVNFFYNHITFSPCLEATITASVVVTLIFFGFYYRSNMFVKRRREDFKPLHSTSACHSLCFGYTGLCASTPGRDRMASLSGVPGFLTACLVHRYHHHQLSRQPKRNGASTKATSRSS